MRNAVIALPDNLDAVSPASRFGLHQGGVIVTDAPTGVIEANATTLQRAGCIPDLQQQEFVMGATSAQSRGRPPKVVPTTSKPTTRV